MYVYYVIFFILTHTFVNCDTICDICACNFLNSDQDYTGLIIDCSHRKVSVPNYDLPKTVHALDLSFNNLNSLLSLKSKTMTELLINNNKLSRLEKSLELPELIQLDLSYNQLEFINADVFKNIKKLEYLNLSHNRFSTFSKLTFHHLSNLKEMILDNNNLGAFLRKTNIFDRNGVGLTQKIKSFSISGIQLNAVPENFFLEAYDLRKLTISNNNLSDLFEIPYTLEYLDISDNPIREIGLEEFSDLPALKELKLNNLLIEEVPDYMFFSLPSLVKLELERNRNLTKFSALAFGLEVLDNSDDFILEELSLKGSRLTNLDERLIEPLGQLIRLDLQGNPWKCDCSIVWLKKLQIPPNDYEHLRCGSPRPFFNSRIFDLKDKYFKCPPNKHHIGLSIAVISYGVILFTISMWLYFFMNRYRSRGSVIQSMTMPSAAYTVLPMSSSVN